MFWRYLYNGCNRFDYSGMDILVDCYVWVQKAKKVLGNGRCNELLDFFGVSLKAFDNTADAARNALYDFGVMIKKDVFKERNDIFDELKVLDRD